MPASNVAILHPRDRPVQVEEIVDLSCYPLTDMQSGKGQRLLRECRRRITNSGVCLLSSFLSRRATAAMAAEALACVPRAHFCHDTHNAYLREHDPAYPSGHARNRRLQSDIGSVATDALPPGGALRRLYEWDPLTDFIAAVLECSALGRSQDPLHRISLSVLEPGAGHAWHFNQSRYTVTILLQVAEHGGYFEYVSGIRTAEDDGYAALGRILDGDESNVVRLPFEAGTLCIFAGSDSIQRVTPVQGLRLRLVCVLCYDHEPGP